MFLNFGISVLAFCRSDFFPPDIFQFGLNIEITLRGFRKKLLNKGKFQRSNFAVILKFVLSQSVFFVSIVYSAQKSFFVFFIY